MRHRNAGSKSFRAGPHFGSTSISRRVFFCSWPLALHSRFWAGAGRGALRWAQASGTCKGKSTGLSRVPALRYLLESGAGDLGAWRFSSYPANYGCVKDKNSCRCGRNSALTRLLQRAPHSAPFHLHRLWLSTKLLGSLAFRGVTSSQPVPLPAAGEVVVLDSSQGGWSRQLFLFIGCDRREALDQQWLLAPQLPPSQSAPTNPITSVYSSSERVTESVFPSACLRQRCFLIGSNFRNCRLFSYRQPEHLEDLGEPHSCLEISKFTPDSGRRSTSPFCSSSA